MPERLWKEHETVLVPDHLSLDDGLVQVAFQTWLLRSAGWTILVDTGIGNDKHDPSSRRGTTVTAAPTCRTLPRPGSRRPTWTSW